MTTHEQEQAALAALRAGLVPVPVRMDNKVLVGVVRLDDLLQLVNGDNTLNSHRDALYDTAISALAVAAVALGLVPEPARAPEHVAVPLHIFSPRGGCSCSVGWSVFSDREGAPEEMIAEFREERHARLFVASLQATGCGGAV